MKKVIYLASTGYSGSTLLELLLGCNKEVINIGEIYKLAYWPSCNCLKPVSDCKFWSAVLKTLRKSTGDSSLKFKDYYLTEKRKTRNYRRLLPELHDLFVAFGCPHTRSLFNSLSPEIATFSQSAKRASLLFSAIRAESNASVIVDSSKEPTLLKHLYCEMPKEVQVIHLIRDGRAVSSSVVKNFDRDGIAYTTEGQNRRPSLKDGAQWWKTRNRNIDLALLRIPKKKHIRLKYEDICLHPQKTCEILSNFLGLPIKVPSEFTPSLSHSIAGNPMRDTKATLKVKLDETWRDRLSEEDLAIFESIAGPYNRRLGYT